MLPIVNDELQIRFGVKNQRSQNIKAKPYYGHCIHTPAGITSNDSRQSE